MNWLDRLKNWLGWGRTPAPAPTPGPQGVDASLLAAHNAERAKAGLGPLVFDASLSSAARSHAQDMADVHILTHYGRDGSTPSQRAARADYRGGTTGENIAEDMGPVPEVMALWMGSPGHRENVLRAAFTHVGFGRVAPYWCVVFGGR